MAVLKIQIKYDIYRHVSPINSEKNSSNACYLLSLNHLINEKKGPGDVYVFVSIRR